MGIYNGEIMKHLEPLIKMGEVPNLSVEKMNSCIAESKDALAKRINEVIHLALRNLMAHLECRDSLKVIGDFKYQAIYESMRKVSCLIENDLRILRVI